MPAYVIAQIELHDRDGYQEYIDGFYRIFDLYGGEVLASPRHPTEVLEGRWTSHSVILRFPSAEAAKAWHSDPDYQRLAKIRHRCAETNLVVVDAVG